MSEAETWKAHVRALIYPVQFNANPLEGIDRVIEQVVLRHALGADERQYRKSIQDALQSGTQLSALLPQDHPEGVIREYLSQLAVRLNEMETA